MQRDGHLWSGCISGAWREDRFVEEFRNAGFQGIQIAKLESDPWQTVEGLEFRSMTIIATKTDTGVCLERNQAVIYRGPFNSISDDDGHTYVRGQRTAVCHRTFETLMAEPYAGQFIAVQPQQEIPIEKAKVFDCSTDHLRDPKVTKGGKMNLPISDGGDCCGDDSSGCC